MLIATGNGAYLDGTMFESVVAAALQLRGASVDVLLCDRQLPACHECSFDRTGGTESVLRDGPRRLLCPGCFEAGVRAFGPLGVRVLRYGDFLTDADRVEARRFAAAAPLDDVAELRLDGLAVGEHALAGTLRFYGRATLEGEPDAQAILRRYLEAAVLAVAVARRAHQQGGYDAVVLHHGIYVAQGLMAEVFRTGGTRVVTWNPAYRNRSFILSHEDTYHHTMLEEPTMTWEAMPWSDRLRDDTLDYLRSRATGAQDWIRFNERPEEDVQAIGRSLGVDFSRPCVGLLTNVMWDAQLLYRTNAFENMRDWCVETVRWFAERPDLQLIVRVHPAEVKGNIPSRQPIIAEILRACERLPANVVLVPPDSPISTYTLMSQCNSVIVYATKAGAELAALGLPVIVAGDAWVRNKGITHDASTIDEYFRILSRLPLPPMSPEQVERAQRFAFHFFFRRMIPLDFMVPTGREPRFAVEIDSMDDLAPGRSRGLDVICDGILAGTPFVYPAELEPASATR